MIRINLPIIFGHAKRWLLLTFTVLLGTTVYAQDPAQYGTPFNGVPDARDAVIYQVNTRAFSATSNFQGVTNRLDNIKALGTNIIYLMPIFPVGTDAKSSNSPYCIKDFQAVGSEYGTLSDLRTLVDGAHSRGMSVILDWVVNQTSWDHPWIIQHPDWYQHDASGNIKALYPDVATIDFSNQAMRTAMITAMRSWVFTANVDGFRCDFADNPPIDFWQQTIGSLRNITSHKLLLLAEGTRNVNYSAGFDYNFGMQFYYNSGTAIYKDGTSATVIDQSNTIEYDMATGNQQIARYLTNHDVDGTDGTPLELYNGKAGSMALFVVVAYMKGVPFIYNGQEVAFPTRITYPWTSVDIDWTINPDVTAEYTKVIAFRNSSNAIRRGTLTSYTNNDVCAFTKTSGSEQVVVFTNLRNSTINYTLPAALANTTWKDAYTGAIVNLGTSISLSAYQYRTLTNASIGNVAVTGVTVSPSSATLFKGATQQLSASIAPANASNQTVRWSSSNTAVATVSASGLLTAVGAGTATVTVMTQDGNKTAASAITVNPPTSFTVYFYDPSTWGTNVKVYWWDAQPTGVLADGTWPGVAMTNIGNGWYSYTFNNISSTNLIFNDGTNQTANLSRSKTGWFYNGTWYDTNPVATTVAVTGVTVSPTSVTLLKGVTQQLSASVAPANATNQSISWSSSNTAVATVSASGLVTAVGAGTASIIVTTQDGNKTATSAITVTAPSSFTVYFYDPSTWGTNVKIYWWDALPAGVLADGTWPGVAMTNIGNGWYSYTFNNISSTNLIFNDGSNQTANLSRSKTGWFYNGVWYDSNPITTVAVTDVMVSPLSATLVKDATQQLSASIAPANASNQTVSWSSSNTAVATVNASGLVTSIAAGTAVITVTTQDGNKTAASTITVTAPISFTVYFYKPSTWGTNIKIYWWNALPAGILADGTWPGVAMTNNGNGWYSYTFNDISSANVIFNDGSNQTANLSRGTTGWFYNGVWYDSNPITTVAVTGVTISPANATLTAGTMQQLSAVVVPANASNQSVSWSSSNTSIVMVSTSGLVTAVGAGTTSVTVTTQDGSKVASAAITVTAIVNKAPTVSLTAPSNGQSYNAPATVTVSANASDSNGSIVKVEFYSGTQLLGTSTASPYAYTWTAVAAGTYSINAKAYDNQNAVTSSSSVSVTVVTVVTNLCTGLATYVENSGYVAGSKVKNVGHLYECKEWPYSGWCNGAAWAYGPGTGSYWTDAWYDRGSCTARESSEIQSSSSQSVSISPNPATNEIAIHLDVNCLVTIYNTQGIEVKNTMSVMPQGSVNISELPAGVYTVKIDTGSQIVTKMLLKN